MTATNAGTQFVSSTVADAQGEFVFASLLPTIYNLSVTVPGFRTFVQNGLAVKVARLLR